jgi:hypothetical protein
MERMSVDKIADDQEEVNVLQVEWGCSFRAASPAGTPHSTQQLLSVYRPVRRHLGLFSRTLIYDKGAIHL